MDKAPQLALLATVMRLDFRAFAAAALFALVPAAAAGGALALPVLVSLTGALSFSAARMRQAVTEHPLWLATLILAGAWIAVSTAWSPNPDATAAKLGSQLILGLLFVAAAASAGRIFRAAGAAAFLVLASLLAVEAMFGFPLNRAIHPDTALEIVALNPTRGALVLLALSWGAAGGMIASGRRCVGLTILALSGVLSVPFGVSAHALGFAAGLAAFGLAFVAPRRAILAVSGGLAAWTLTAPLLTPALARLATAAGPLPFSWEHRLAIWTQTCSEIWSAPWIGHGLGASRALPGIAVAGQMTYPPLHPHSASLQLWYETGAVGAVLAAFALITGGRALARALGGKPAAAAAAAASLLSLGFIANVSFSLWAEWWVASLLIAAALTAASARRPQAL